MSRVTVCLFLFASHHVRSPAAAVPPRSWKAKERSPSYRFSSPANPARAAYLQKFKHKAQYGHCNNDKVVNIFQYAFAQESVTTETPSTAAADESAKSSTEEVKVTKAPEKDEQEDISESKASKDKSTKPVIEENSKPSPRRTSPLDQLKGLEISGNIIPPVMQAREKIGDTVTKGVDGVKAMADSAYNFLREAVGKIF